MEEVVLIVVSVSAVISTLMYKRMYHAELDKRLKYEVEVKDLILEHNRITESMKRSSL